jgi:hypothetical protein
MDKSRTAAAIIVVLGSTATFAALILGFGNDSGSMVLWGSVSASAISLVCLIAAVLFYTKSPSERYAELHPPDEDDSDSRG